MYRTITEYTSEVHGSHIRIYSYFARNKHLGITSSRSGSQQASSITTKSGWVFAFACARLPAKAILKACKILTLSYKQIILMVFD